MTLYIILGCHCLCMGKALDYSLFGIIVLTLNLYPGDCFVQFNLNNMHKPETS